MANGARNLVECEMSNEWGENKPSQRLTKRLHESEDNSTSVATTAIGRVASKACAQMQRVEHSAEQQIRRYPLSSVMVAIGVGMVVGGLMSAAFIDSCHVKYSVRWLRLDV